MRTPRRAVAAFLLVAVVAATVGSSTALGSDDAASTRVPVVSNQRPTVAVAPTVPTIPLPTTTSTTVSPHIVTEESPNTGDNGLERKAPNDGDDAVVPRPSLAKCPTNKELNTIIRKSMTSTQSMIKGTKICVGGWAYAGVTGVDIGGGQRSDETRILLFWVEGLPGGQKSKWFVKYKFGTGKLDSSEPLCVSVPPTVRKVLCI